MRKVSPALAQLMPDTVEDWQTGRADQTYDRENLYEYINGGAELYLSYGFQELINRTYTQSGQPDIIVDIFDMGSSRNAFGVFSHSREAIESDFGQGSEYYEGFLQFWRDRYLVSILASPETVESKRALSILAKGIDSSIGRDGPLPEILKILPEQSLVMESVRYFRHHVWMNLHYFVAEENILNINEKTDALLAKYGEVKERHILLLVMYQNEEEAKAAYSNFVKLYLPELIHKPTAQVEDGTWTSSRLSGRLLTIVFNAASETTALDLMEAVNDKVQLLESDEL